MDQKEPNAGWIDHDFIKENYIGLEDVKSQLDSITWEDIVARYGISEAEIRKVARIYGQAKASIACWAWAYPTSKWSR